MQLSRQVNKTRVQTFLEVGELLAYGPKLMVTAGREGANAERKREELLNLLSQLSKANRTLFKDLLKTHRSVISDAMRLTPEKASSLQHSLKMQPSSASLALPSSPGRRSSGSLRRRSARPSPTTSWSGAP